MMNGFTVMENQLAVWPSFWPCTKLLVSLMVSLILYKLQSLRFVSYLSLMYRDVTFIMLYVVYIICIDTYVHRDVTFIMLYVIYIMVITISMSFQKRLMITHVLQSEPIQLAFLHCLEHIQASFV